MESFFADVVSEILNSSSLIFQTVNTSVPAGQVKSISGKNPPKSAVYALLIDFPHVQSVVWNHFNMSECFPLPRFPNSLLYGGISTLIHNPDIKGMVVSDKASPAFRGFFREIAMLYEVKYTEYDEQLATVAPEMCDFPVSID